MANRLMAGLTSALCLAALAQTTTITASASSAPVAYVYVALDGSINAYTAATDGTLTEIGTQPTAGAVWHLSVTKKFLYGIDGESNIWMFAIGPHGALTSLGVVKTSDYDPDNCYAFGDLQVDETGSNIYALVGDCDGHSYLASFKIESTGKLLYLGRSYGNSWAQSQVRFTANNVYAFQTGCQTKPGSQIPTPQTAQYKRESNGFLTYLGTTHEVPEGSGDESFCPFMMTSHGNQLAFEYLRWGKYSGNGYPLGVYTVASDGKLSTKSNYENMAITGVYPETMSISPSGEVLAVGGDGEFQFFHFDGSTQPVEWSSPIAADNDVTELGWDNSGHFYALTESSLYVYKVTATSYTQEAGLPNAFTNAGSVIVLSLD
jgi:hypothetical protein